MSGKIVSQFKDAETIESAFKSCQDERTMNSAAVLTEVLGLLKNETHSRRALETLSNYMGNGNSKKNVASYVLKTLSKMKGLIPEHIDVFLPFLQNQDSKKDAWTCVEKMVSGTFVSGKQSSSKSPHIKTIAIESEIPNQLMNVLESDTSDDEEKSIAGRLLVKICLKPNEKIFNELAKSIFSEEKRARTLVEMYIKQSQSYAKVLARLCDIPECRRALCVADALQACDRVLKASSENEIFLSHEGTLKYVCKILSSIICDTTLDDLTSPNQNNDENILDPCTVPLESLGQVLKLVVESKEFSEPTLDMTCMLLIRLCQRKPRVFNLNKDDENEEYSRVDAIKAEFRRVHVLDSLVSSLLRHKLRSGTRGHVEKVVSLLLVDFSQVMTTFVGVKKEFVKLVLQGVASSDSNTSSLCARILRILLNNLESRSLVRAEDGTFVICSAWRTSNERSDDEKESSKKSATCRKEKILLLEMLLLLLDPSSDIVEELKKFGRLGQSKDDVIVFVDGLMRTYTFFLSNFVLFYITPFLDVGVLIALSLSLSLFFSLF
jgi:hypothetical protein